MVGFSTFRIGAVFFVLFWLFSTHRGDGINIKKQRPLRHRSTGVKKRHASRWARIYKSLKYKRQAHNSNKRIESAFGFLVYGFPSESKPISIEVLKNVYTRNPSLVAPFVKLLRNVDRHDRAGTVEAHEAPAVWSFRRKQLHFVRLNPLDAAREAYQTEIDYRLTNHLVSNDRNKKMTYSLGKGLTPPLPEWIARIVDLEFYATRVVFVLDRFVSKNAVPLQWFNFHKAEEPPSYDAITTDAGVEKPPSLDEIEDTIAAASKQEPSTIRQELSLEFLSFNEVPQVLPAERRLNDVPVAAALYGLKPQIVRSITEFPKWYFWINSEMSEMYLRLVDEKETTFDDIRVIDSYSTLAKFVTLSPETLVTRQKQSADSSSKFSPIEQLQLRNRCCLCETRETVYFRVFLSRLLLQAQGDPWETLKPPISRNTGLAKRRIDAIFRLVNSNTACKQFFQTPLSLSEYGATSIPVTAAYVQKIAEGSNMVKYIISFCGSDKYLCGFDECSVLFVNEYISEFEGAERVRFPPATWLELKPSPTGDGRPDVFDWEPAQLVLVRK